jgi:hypothetical protein
MVVCIAGRENILTSGRQVAFLLCTATGTMNTALKVIYGGQIEQDNVPLRRWRAMVHWTRDGILQLTGYSEVGRDQDADKQILTSTLKQRILNGDEGWKWAVEKFAVTDGG